MHGVIQTTPRQLRSVDFWYKERIVWPCQVKGTRLCRLVCLHSEIYVWSYGQLDCSRACIYNLAGIMKETVLVQEASGSKRVLTVEAVTSSEYERILSAEGVRTPYEFPSLMRPNCVWHADSLHDSLNKMSSWAQFSCVHSQCLRNT